MAGAEGSFLLVAEADAVAIGFIAGSVAVGRLYRDFLVYDGIPAVVSAPGPLVRAWPRVLETLRHPASEADASGGELLAVAVDPGLAGPAHRGATHRRLSRRAGAAGHVTRAQVVVGADNVAAMALYHRTGFTARTLGSAGAPPRS